MGHLLADARSAGSLRALGVKLALDVSYAKELIHLLQAKTLGLRNEEPHKDTHEKIKDMFISTYVTGRSHCLLHGKHSSGDDKVKEPLGSSSDGDVEGSETGSRNLRNENPAARSPTELEESSPEVNADNSNITESRDTCASNRGLNATVDTDDVHGEELSSTCPQKTAASTKRVGKEDEEGSTS
ncbi:hypothetical protein HG531_006217 [Fusarium graminearum]|nr:hypothetical protein HG531_006217 [Fusarium graminearum]